jgi:hypothetical protein
LRKFPYFYRINADKALFSLTIIAEYLILININKICFMKRFSRILSVLFISFIGNSVIQAQVATDLELQLCHNWTISAIEVMGAETEVPLLNANDKVNIHNDKTIELTIDGTNYAGTWTVNDAGTWMTIALPGNTGMRLQLNEVTDTKLKVDHINESGDHTIFIFAH